MRAKEKPCDKHPGEDTATKDYQCPVCGWKIIVINIKDTKKHDEE